MNIENVEKTESTLAQTPTSQSTSAQKKEKEKEEEGFDKLVDSLKKPETAQGKKTNNLKDIKDFTGDEEQNGLAAFVAYNDFISKQNLAGVKIKNKVDLSDKKVSKNKSDIGIKMFGFEAKTFKIDDISPEDEKFLKLLSTKTNMVIDKMNAQTNTAEVTIPTQDGLNVSYKTQNFSKGLFNLVEYAFTAKKPVRLSFAGNSSVILKVDKDGQLSAEFLSSDKAMEAALKSNIPFLKNKLDSEGVPYKQIYYKDQDQNQNEQQKRERNKGE